MRNHFSIFLALIGSFLVLYIVIPILLILIVQALDFNSLILTLSDELVLSSLINSIATSTATMIISLLLGVPLGYVLAREDFIGKNFVQAVIDLPIVIPHSVVGIILLLTYSEAILDNYLGIISAMLFVSASFTVNSARDGFLAVEEKTEFVARTLGASKLKVFFTVSLPLAFPSILSGAIMTWARAMSEVGALLIVAYYPKTAQVLVMDYFNNYGLSSSQPIAVILILISLTIFVLLRRIADAKS
ncbi:MAG: ABC transporter permease [Archaeoglobaceae archaeon]|nr:ABC transporter permease [Archaeoglobaceae archaeon]MDW8117399.1 ABC transporter permease [Archaeoglobaceae archaeon]